MSVESVTSQTQVYDSYNAGSAAKASDTAKKEEAAKKETTAAKTETKGVVYEKSEEKSDSSKKATYSVNKMSAEDRAALVQQLKADEKSRQDQLTSLVQQMMTKQGVAIGTADDMWKFLAKGDFTVSADVKAQAQADIADDGYWGVEQTSDRILDFAKALSGDDPDKADAMLEAFKKGFEQATKAWGDKLPDISQRTNDAVVEKFNKWKNGTEDASTEA